MSVLPMKRVRIIGMRKDRKQILELLQRSGVVQIEAEKSEAAEEAEDPVFRQIDMSGIRATFDKNVVLANQALEVLAGTSPDPNPVTMFSGRRKMSLTDYETGAAKRDKTMDMVYRLNTLSKQANEISAEIPRVETQLEALTPWLSFPYPMDFDGTGKTKAFIGTLQNEVSEETIRSGITEAAPELEAFDVSIISTSQEQTCIMVVCLRSQAKEMEEALRHIGYARPALSGDVPAKQKEALEKKLQHLHEKAEDTASEIASFAENRDEIKFIADYFQMRSDKYEVISGLKQSKRVFFLSGYICERDAKGLEDLLDSRFDCVVEFKTPAEDEDVPVALQNNGFAAPVEGVVESYSLPGRGEDDPTFPVSWFYYILFGLMLSDAAYGLLMAIGCAFILWKFKNMEDSTKKTMKMFLFCGIGTTFWGFMFGSFFGDAVAVMGTTFFGKSADYAGLRPVWFAPIDDPIHMLRFSFLIGLIHLFTGLALKLVQCIKKGQILDAIYDVVFWYMLVGGAVVLLLTVPMVSSMIGLESTLPAYAGTVATYIMIVAAVGIILTGGRESKNWGKRILKGLYSLYGITSYLSDVLSYSRLLALGLATGVIAQVFNKMGSMVAAAIPIKPIGFIIFMVIFLIGHVLNLGINALGAYVHTNRLQYVEFFGKFYNGGGRPFEPFKEKTKYYKVQE